jgi:spore maturation protein CgeB
MDVFARNLAALAQVDSALAAALAACTADPDVRVEHSGSGAVTLSCGGRLEASREDPEAEARELAASFAAAAARAGATRWVLFGLGVHTLRALELPPGPVLVVEPSLALCRALLGALDLSAVLGRIALLVGEDLAPVLRHPAFRGEPRGIFLAHPAARRRARALHDALAERFAPGSAGARLDVMVVPPLVGGSLPVAHGAARALRELGHRVREVDWTPFCAAYAELERVCAPLQLQAGLPGLRAALSRVLGELVLARCAVDPPDLIFALAQAPLDGPTLAGLGRRGIARAFWFCEDAHVLPYWRELCTAYDAFFHVQPALLAEPLRAAGVYAAELPLGFDPELHRPLELGAEQRQRYACALSFVAAGYHNRQQFVPGLADLGLRLYGTSWPAVSPFLELSPEFGAWQSSEDSNLIFNASKINLNLHSSPWTDGVNPAGDYLNPRTFELAGARAFQLVDARSELPRFFEPERELVTFRDLAECRRKIAYYLAHEDERREIAERAQRRALAEHRYRDRMQSALERICAGPVPLAPRRRAASAGAVAADPDCERALRAVLERLDPERLLDADALGEAVQLGESELSEAEQLLLFMRESMRELVPAGPGQQAP